MEILGKLLGTPARVKIMRLFLLNKNKTFTNKDIVKRSRVTISSIRKEVNLLASVDFIKRHTVGWSFNPSFKYMKEFENLLVSADTLDDKTVIDNFKRVGRIKLLIVSGVFIKNKDSRLDLLIVGDKLKRGKIEEGIRRLEAEIGAEVVYAI